VAGIGQPGVSSILRSDVNNETNIALQGEAEPGEQGRDRERERERERDKEKEKERERERTVCL